MSNLLLSRGCGPSLWGGWLLLLGILAPPCEEVSPSLWGGWPLLVGMLAPPCEEVSPSLWGGWPLLVRMLPPPLWGGYSLFVRREAHPFLIGLPFIRRKRLSSTWVLDTQVLHVCLGYASIYWLNALFLNSDLIPNYTWYNDDSKFDSVILIIIILHYILFFDILQIYFLVDLKDKSIWFNR